MLATPVLPRTDAVMHAHTPATPGINVRSRRAAVHRTRQAAHAWGGPRQSRRRGPDSIAGADVRAREAAGIWGPHYHVGAYPIAPTPAHAAPLGPTRPLLCVARARDTPTVPATAGRPQRQRHVPSAHAAVLETPATDGR
ncbi:hypothetical protein OBBRIDRAFT_832262 [Obba rivulosa]|uniref:Uncharacterized protein n=1 Tax=Obba rivulosa TaxID=1052685 RepID=A0A8E2DQS8_9APHY|nr:hypothetical protein OBBRIDRAFT_832262 [Obba rivulosa]